MATNPESSDSVNMIPLIDCMFFLIVFFLLVVRFTPDEKAIASLLPTDKGQRGTATAPPREQINLAIVPAGFEPGHQPSDYERQLASSETADAWMRVGGSASFPIRNDRLQITTGDARVESEVEAIAAYVRSELEARELAGKPRSEQAPIIISCYSGLPWKYALLAYDAIRAFEADHSGAAEKRDLLLAREVSFAPPPIRNWNRREHGNEIYEIVNLR